MRESLKQSVADSPAEQFEKYPKGSIVLCHACALPIFKLDFAITLGDKGGQAVKAFKPLGMADLDALVARDDADAGVRASISAMSHEQRVAHVSKLREFVTGEPMACPSCKACFVQVLAVTRHEVMDRSYTMELLTIPPAGIARPAPVRGKRLGYKRDWVHESGWTVH
jgi:hypothetical protein